MFILMYHSVPSKGKKKLIVIHQCSPKPTPLLLPLSHSQCVISELLSWLPFSEVIPSGREKKVSSKLCENVRFLNLAELGNKSTAYDPE